MCTPQPPAEPPTAPQVGVATLPVEGQAGRRPAPGVPQVEPAVLGAVPFGSEVSTDVISHVTSREAQGSVAPSVVAPPMPRQEERPPHTGAGQATEERPLGAGVLEPAVLGAVPLDSEAPPDAPVHGPAVVVPLPATLTLPPRTLAYMMEAFVGVDLANLLRTIDQTGLVDWDLNALENFLRANSVLVDPQPGPITVALLRRELVACVIALHPGTRRWRGWMPSEDRRWVYLWDSHYDLPFVTSMEEAVLTFQVGPILTIIRTQHYQGLTRQVFHAQASLPPDPLYAVLNPGALWRRPALRSAPASVAGPAFFRAHEGGSTGVNKEVEDLSQRYEQRVLEKQKWERQPCRSTDAKAPRSSRPHPDQ